MKHSGRIYTPPAPALRSSGYEMRIVPGCSGPGGGGGLRHLTQDPQPSEATDSRDPTVFLYA
jgi:hypothetical protein